MQQITFSWNDNNKIIQFIVDANVNLLCCVKACPVLTDLKHIDSVKSLIFNPI